MFVPLTIYKTKTITTTEPLKVNARQKLFCELYTSSEVECFGNATRCYMKAYGTKNVLQAKSLAQNLIQKPNIMAYINGLLSDEGFNDQNVDKQHLFVINQHKDLSTKMKGIEHYNKLKKRIENKLEIILPKPIMELDDDETIRMIDKKKAIDVTSSQVNVIIENEKDTQAPIDGSTKP